MLKLLLYSRDHSFPWNTEFWAEPRNFHVLAEFCWIRYCPVKSVQIRNILIGWSGHRKLITTCRHDCTMKYITGTPALAGGILKILNLPAILPVYLVDRLQTCQLWLLRILHISSGSGGCRKLVATCEKLAAISRRIWQTGPRNLETFATENCSAYCLAAHTAGSMISSWHCGVLCLSVCLSVCALCIVVLRVGVGIESCT